jgi:hypothetical protein
MPTTFMCQCIFLYLTSGQWFNKDIMTTWQLNTMQTLRCTQNTEINDRFVTLITCTSN